MTLKGDANFKGKLTCSLKNDLTLLSPGGMTGGGGVIFAHGKLKFNLFTFTRDYFAGEKNSKNITLSGGNIFIYRGYCQQIGVRICRNSFSCRI